MEWIYIFFEENALKNTKEKFRAVSYARGDVRNYNKILNIFMFYPTLIYSTHD